MKAIDFACRLLMNLQHNKLSPERQRILIALGAGLETCHDIAHHCVLSGQQTAAQLLAMERSELINKDSKHKPYNYKLSNKGKKTLKEIFTFLPHSDHT